MRKYNYLFLLLGLLLVMGMFPEKGEASEYEIIQLNEEQVEAEKDLYNDEHLPKVLTLQTPSFNRMWAGDNDLKPKIQLIDTGDIRYISFSDYVRGDRFKALITEFEKIPKGEEEKSLKNVYLTDLDYGGYRGFVTGLERNDMFLFHVDSQYFSKKIYATFYHEYGHIFTNYWLLDGENATGEWKEYAPSSIGGDEYISSSPEYLAEQYKYIYSAHLNKTGYSNASAVISDSFNPNVPLFNSPLRSYFEKVSGVKSTAPTENPITIEGVELKYDRYLYVNGSFERTTKDEELAVMIGVEGMNQSTPSIMEEASKENKRLFFADYYCQINEFQTFKRTGYLHSSYYKDEIYEGKPFWVRLVSKNKVTGAVSDSDKKWFIYSNGKVIELVTNDQM